jgi:hypothetical protein
LTASRRVTNKLSEYIRFLNFSTFRDESKVDKLGIDLLIKAGLDSGHIKEMLNCLSKSKKTNFGQKILTRMRLLKIHLRRTESVK